MVSLFSWDPSLVRPNVLLQPASFHQVLSESDLDNDNMLSFSEFEHAMAKSPDFMK